MVESGFGRTVDLHYEPLPGEVPKLGRHQQDGDDDDGDDDDGDDADTDTDVDTDVDVDTDAIQTDGVRPTSRRTWPPKSTAS